jgi:hypothetical protein
MPLEEVEQLLRFWSDRQKKGETPLRFKEAEAKELERQKRQEQLANLQKLKRSWVDTEDADHEQEEDKSRKRRKKGTSNPAKGRKRPQGNESEHSDPAPPKRPKINPSVQPTRILSDLARQKNLLEVWDSSPYIGFMEKLREKAKVSFYLSG